jgi:predicted DNA binding protein
MTVLSHFDIPVTDLALAETFQTVPEATVVCEQHVACSIRNPLPLIRVRAPDQSAFKAALTADPTVDSFTLLDDTGPAWLYRIEWAHRVHRMIEILTHADAIIRDAAGSADGWQLRVHYPDRETLRSTHEFCEAHNLSIDIRTIRSADGDTRSHLGPGGILTHEQYEAIKQTYMEGYFEIPRANDLETVSDTLGISHQALSERLRRAHRALIENALTGTDRTGTGAGNADCRSVIHPAVNFEGEFTTIRTPLSASGHRIRSRSRVFCSVV